MLVYALGAVKTDASASAFLYTRAEALAVLRGASRSLRALSLHRKARVLAAAGFDKAVFLFR